MERAATVLQEKNSLYHTAINGYNPGLDEHSEHYTIETLNSNSDTNFMEQQDYFSRARKGQRLKSREKALMQQEDILLQKEYDLLISVIRKTKDKNQQKPTMWIIQTQNQQTNKRNRGVGKTVPEHSGNNDSPIVRDPKQSSTTKKGNLFDLMSTFTNEHSKPATAKTLTNHRSSQASTHK